MKEKREPALDLRQAGAAERLGPQLRAVSGRSCAAGDVFGGSMQQ